MKSVTPAQHTATPARATAGRSNTPFFQCTKAAGDAPRPFFQARLEVSQPDDPHEREADRAADQVMRTLDAPATASDTGSWLNTSTLPSINRVSIPSASAAASEATTPEMSAPEEVLDEPLQRMADPWLSNQAADDPSAGGAGALQRKPTPFATRHQGSRRSTPDRTTCVSEGRTHVLTRPRSVGAGTISRQPIRSRPDLARGPPGRTDTFSQKLAGTKGRGQPLPEQTRSSMESAFGADFSHVRVHTDQEAGHMASRAGAVAFAHEGDVYFNRGQFQPDTRSGRHLLAHELTHVVQQGRAVQRQRIHRRTLSRLAHAGSAPARAPPRESVAHPIPTLTAVAPQIQCDLIPDWARAEINSYAEAIPGYTLMTVVVGYNPILDTSVEWSARNFFRGAAGLIPLGTAIFDKLNEGGAIDGLFAWITAQIEAHKLSLSRVRSLFNQAWDRMDFLRTDPIDYNVGVVRSVFSGFLGDVTSFAGAVVTKLIEVFKDLAIQAVRALFGENSAAYDLITQVLGEDPLTGEARAWDTANFLRAALRLFGFESHLAKLEETGQLEQAAAWIDGQVGLLVSAFSGLITGVTDLWTSLSLERLVRPDQLLTDTLNVVLTFVGRLAEFALNLATKVLELIKEILIALARTYLHGKPGYTLFTVVLGQDPVTGEEVPRTATNFVRGFLEFVPGGAEIYRNLVEGNAVGRVMDWLSAQVEELGLSPAAIMERVLTLWNSFSIDDIFDPLGAFERIAGTVLGFVGDVLTLAGRIAFKVLEILFEVVMGGAGGRIMEILRRGQGTFRTIVEDPIAFVGNLIGAVRQGFEQFGTNIWTHLQTGLFGWLFGALEGAGLRLPQQWNLQGILDLALQVLGLTYQQIRPRLVQHLGEAMVSHLETAFEFVRLIVTEGLGAAWEKILEFVSDNLVSVVIDGIKDWVITNVVTAAITRLATMFNPAGAVIQAILAIYNTVMFFIERLDQILDLAESVINSVSAIASGAIGDAANFVEQSMARTIPVIISFLARLLGLGGISEQIRRIITRIQAPVSRALDLVIGWIVRQARALFRGVLQAGTGDMSPEERLREGVGLAVRAVNRFRGRRVGEAVLSPLLEGIKVRYSLDFLRVEPVGDRWTVHGRINPEATAMTDAQCESPTTTPGADAAPGDSPTPAAEATEAEQAVLTAFKAAHPSGRVALRSVSSSLAVPHVASGQITTHIRNLVTKRHLFYYQSGTNDPYKMVTAESSKAGSRSIPAAGRRQLFGYSNPGHDSPTGRTVLAGGIDWESMGQTPASVPTSTRSSWDFLNTGRFRSWKTGTRNFPRHDAVLGHDTPANEHWNDGAGMANARTGNQSWSNQVSTYGGVEERHESSGEGGERYADPMPPRAARCWWDPADPEYPRVSGYDWDFTGVQTKLENSGDIASDPLEREADGAADTVVARRSSLPAISRQPAPGARTSQHTTPGPPRRGGSLLAPAVRRPMEGAFAHDFSGVRIHTDPSAATAARGLGARAFTHGRDIYFNRGEYAPHTRSGQHLLAHELTHVVQQSSGSAPRSIQRSTDPPATNGSAPSATPAPPAPTEFTLANGSHIERTPKVYPGSATARKRAQINGISLPSFKSRNRKRFPHVLAVRPHSREVSNTQQPALWRESVQSGVQLKLDTLCERARAKGGHDPTSGTYYFQADQNRSLYLIGTRDALLDVAMVPFWSRDGRSSAYQIDHVVEDQLVNFDDPSLTGLTSADRASNFELLEAAANGASGQAIYGEINRRLRQLVTDFKAQYPGEPPIEFNALRHGGYYVTFLGRTFDLAVAGGEQNNYWSHRQIRQGEHLNKLTPLNGRQVHGLGHRGSPPLIFLSGFGGQASRVPPTDQLPKENWLPRITLKSVEYNEDPKATPAVTAIHVDAYRAAEAREGFITSSYADMRWPLLPVPGVHGGAVDVAYVKQHYLGAALSLHLRGMSPIELSGLDLGPRGLSASGKVLPTIPFIRNADVDVVIDGRAVRLRKRFGPEEIALPAPFQVDDCALEVFAGTNGLGASGSVAFSIPNVGRGRVAGSVATEGGLEIDGEFDFDSKLFTQARIAVGYHEGAWDIAGKLAIGPDRVRGIKSAEVDVAYANDILTAAGAAELAIPGVQRGAVNLTLSPEGFSFGGDFQLTGDIPGIQSGRIGVTVAKTAGTDHYAVSARGSAVLRIPGVSSEVAVVYEDGALDIGGSVDYSRDLLSGRLEVHATNRAVGEDGKPAGGPTDRFTLFGGGQLTITITPWLRGTVSVTLLPNGEIEVGGEIAVPKSIPVFRRLGIPRKELFGLRFDIPIFGIPVGPKTIGIKAFIKGGLFAEAGVGPGELQDLHLGFKNFNPAHPESTHIYGGGAFDVRADASLSLEIRAGIGLDALIGGVEGSLGPTATLSLNAHARPAARIDWMPGRGFALSGDLEASIRPRFLFQVTGEITAWFAVWDKTWTWNLADFEYGPDFTLGLNMPLKYVEGTPFSPTVGKDNFTYPDLSGNEGFFKGMFKAIRNQRGETASPAISNGFIRAFEVHMKRDPVRGRQVIEEIARQENDIGKAARKYLHGLDRTRGIPGGRTT